MLTNLEINGHDIEAIYKAAEVHPRQGALVILAYTNPCQGMDYLGKRRPKLHYIRFQSDDAVKELEDAIRKQLYPSSGNH